MTGSRARNPWWQRAYGWLTSTRQAETPEVREALLLTLAEPRVVTVLSFAWTQAVAWMVVAVTGSALALLWVVADVTVFMTRLRLAHGHDAALEAGEEPPRRAMLACDLAGFALVATGVGASFTAGNPALNLLLVTVLVGMIGYVTSRLAAFPRVAAIVNGYSTAAFAAGLLASPLHGAWALAAVSPSIALGFQLLTLNNHRILVTSLRAQQENRRLSLHDPLTGLPNRLHLYERLAVARQRSQVDAAYRVAVLYLDLDGFKAVNDELGHPVGDLLLKEVAARLSAGLAPGQLVARLGGDEFVVLMPGADRTAATAAATALVELLGQEYRFGADLVVQAGTSIGISLGPDDGADPDDLLAYADQALYEAKRTAKGTWRFHSEAAPAPVPASARRP